MAAMWLSVIKFKPIKVGTMSSYLHSFPKAFSSLNFAVLG
jgi:hypothetical protein